MCKLLRFQMQLAAQITKLVFNLRPKPVAIKNAPLS